MRSQIWFEKYRPRKYTDLVFKEDVHHDVLRWLRDYPAHGRILLLKGPPGTGKTSLVHVLSSVFGLNLVEFNASDDPKYIEKISGAYGTIDGKKNLIFIDEIDSIPLADLERLVSSIKLVYPVVMTSNEIHLEDVYTVEIKRPGISEIRKGIERICKEEGVYVGNSALLQMAEDSGGDFRAIINHLQVHKERLQNSKDLGIGKSASLVQHRAVELVLTKRMGWKTYEDVYSANVLSLCHSSFPHNTGLMRLVADISEATSLADILPEEFRYISLSRYNMCNSKKASIQSMVHYEETMHDPVRERVLPYFKKYDLNRADRRSLNHLREIVRMYNIMDVRLREEDTAESNMGDGFKRFKFKYKPGSSSAFRRDVTMDDVMDWFFSTRH
ncbi:replication factor C large subunit [Encephalitozoon hellem ATCC 50504]|uniref:Replication factor C protein Rad17 n=1 Tax=Encephalitozoon hellem TaxID=27973 RepID=A0A9Q9CAP4_ENCHE|nr:replication factor C large subunit [Encephalitozoon hellem ATCC 50504]AFM97731.1 replication factor C large subunit [Encephalitozoon hellem ATCC 50504]UTX42423.1 putative replication factor C protein Rad17 [Encephalitozoon hellem]|eukprot:XP_003886712.1 replication factor C large subunit [Encephalitozoon hellem ATCC 50504]